MDDSELLNEALRRGGADAVTKQLPKGIDEELNKDWMPPADGKGEVEARGWPTVFRCAASASATFGWTWRARATG